MMYTLLFLLNLRHFFYWTETVYKIFSRANEDFTHSSVTVLRVQTTKVNSAKTLLFYPNKRIASRGNHDEGLQVTIKLYLPIFVPNHLGSSSNADIITIFHNLSLGM